MNDEMEPLKIPLVRRPTFVIEENGSDYSSMASGDSDAAEKEVGNDDIKDSKQQFKSAFAQELTVKTPKTDIGHHYSSDGLTKSQFDQILDKTLDFRKAQEDYLRVKQENARLRMEIEKQKHEEHHEVEDQNEHRQPGRSEEKTVERGPPKKEKEIPPEVAFSWPSSRSHALSLGKLKSDCQLCAHSFITSSLLLFLFP